MRKLGRMFRGGMIGVTLCAAAGAGAAVGWRHDGTGYFPDANAPLRWSAEENVVWKTELEDFSNAHPVLVGDKLFVCVEPATLVCIRAKDGTILWQRTKTLDEVRTDEDRARLKANQERAAELRREKSPLEDRLTALRERLNAHPQNRELTRQFKEAEAAYRKNRRDQELKARVAALDKERRTIAELAAVYEEADELDKKIKTLDKEINELSRTIPRTHKVNGYTSPTAVSDGTNVYVLYGSGVAAAYSLDGTERWARSVEQPTHGWGHSASPVLAGGNLILHVIHLTALDPATGDEVWRVPSKARWGSPVVARIGDVEGIITANGELVRAVDGQILAKGLHGLQYCAPLVDDGVVYFIENGGTAYRLPVSGDEPSPPERLWRTAPRKDRYYASPVCHEGRIFAIDRAGNYSVIDAASGEVLGARKLDLGGTAYPSITFAGGRLYVSSDTGKTLVLEPAVEYKELAVNQLPRFRSSPLFDGERVYIRTERALYCIGR